MSQNISPQGYTPYSSSRDTDRYGGDRLTGSRTNENITAVPSSVTNLSHHSDTISSHSSGHSNGSSKQEYREELRARQEKEYREELRARQEQDFKEEFRARQEQEFRRDQKARQQQYAKGEPVSMNDCLKSHSGVFELLESVNYVKLIRRHSFAVLTEDKRPGAMSPSGRRRHTVVGQRGRAALESSPHSSNNSSPQAVRR